MNMLELHTSIKDVTQTKYALNLHLICTKKVIFFYCIWYFLMLWCCLCCLLNLSQIAPLERSASVLIVNLTKSEANRVQIVVKTVPTLKCNIV